MSSIPTPCVTDVKCTCVKHLSLSPCNSSETHLQQTLSIPPCPCTSPLQQTPSIVSSLTTNTFHSFLIVTDVERLYDKPIACASHCSNSETRLQQIPPIPFSL